MNLVELSLKIGVEGFMHPGELDKLVELACNRDVLEIGSFKGLSASWMATVAKSLTCIDTFRANSAGQQQMGDYTTFSDFRKATDRFRNVTVHIGSSDDAVWAPNIRPMFDLIFLDAMHTYPDVKGDIARWWPRVRQGGLMAFHDYGHPAFEGVKQAVDEIFGPQTNVVGTLMWMTQT